MKQLIAEIEKQTDFLVLLRNSDVDVDRTVHLKNRAGELTAMLEDAFRYTDVSYEFQNKYIVLSRNKPSGELARQQQGKRITGTVVDQTGEPVIGANVLEKGVATNGTVTDVDGNFSLDVAENAVLQVSFIGYITQEISVLSAREGGESLLITLLEDALALEEVIVVGYGTQKKVNLTGAVSSVSSEVLNKRQVGQTSLALQGVAPGVTVTQRNGQPGVDGGDIRIRGIGTLNNANPLILVDGLEMGLNNLDVNTIESISVLKDAASASIYGSKAANGVILVTTKRA
ncbi:MAG: TonB-dependent receptor plug domain-containing protein, partial [Tannerella sp.]|nr:TonB-dependent receptor plug domain-containing protein [Tannerella sp.]